MWKEGIALTQDVGKSCKKRKHSMKHWRKLSDVMDTMVPHSLFLFGGGGGEGGAYTGFIQACICVHGVHACFGSCSLDTFMVPEDESYRASVEWI